MPETTTGIRSVLSRPAVYNLTLGFLGSKRARQMLAEDYIKAKPGDRVLDIGCGTADILNYLPEVEYRGYDISAEYIDACRERFPQHKFEVATLPPPDAGLFDIVLALGVLHHLSNEESLALLRSAKEHLKPGGRVVTFDGCRRGNPLEAVMYALDRGRAINDAEG